jgi:sulfur carrier protein
MNLHVNGEPYAAPTGLTVAGLLQALGLGTERVAVAVNGEVAPKSGLDRRRLEEGDVVEVIHAVAGG